MSSGTVQRDVNSSTIVYVEPNSFNNSNEDLCSTAIVHPYEKYNILVDLIVEMQDRYSCGIANGPGISGLKDKKYIHFIGGSNGWLTTNYTDWEFKKFDACGNSEAIGIESIKINHSSWFMPQIQIMFTDVRGASLMLPMEGAVKSQLEKERDNNETPVITNVEGGSFFKALFSFPPPVFYLRIKGFYGDSVTFHLAQSSVKLEFDASTGNFKIDARFIGHMYGVFADIPMVYCAIAPFMRNGAEYWNTRKGQYGFYEDDGETKTGQKMIDFIEFRRRCNSLFGEATSAATNSSTNESYRDNLEIIQSVDSLLVNFPLSTTSSDESIKWYKDGNTYYKFVKGNDNFEYERTLATRFTVWRSNLTKSIKNKSWALNSFSNIDIDSTQDMMTRNINVVSTFSVLELSLANVSISTGSEGNSVFNYPSELNTLCEESSSFEGYLKTVIRDIINSHISYKCYRYTSDYDYEAILNTIRNDAETENKSNAEIIAEEKKLITNNVLGFSPSIRNSYNLIFSHMDCFIGLFYNMLNEVRSDMLENKRKASEILHSYSDSDLSESDYANLNLPPFPLFTKEIREGNSRKRVAKFPTDYDDSSEKIANMPEVKFVLDMLDATGTFRIKGEEFELSESLGNEDSSFVFLPTDIYDIHYSPSMGGNPYSFIAEEGKDDMGYWAITTFMYRLTKNLIFNPVVAKKWKNFAAIEAFNLIHSMDQSNYGRLIESINSYTENFYHYFLTDAGQIKGVGENEKNYYRHEDKWFMRVCDSGDSVSDSYYYIWLDNYVVGEGDYVPLPVYNYRPSMLEEIRSTHDHDASFSVMDDVPLGPYKDSNFVDFISIDDILRKTAVAESSVKGSDGKFVEDLLLLFLGNINKYWHWCSNICEGEAYSMRKSIRLKKTGEYSNSMTNYDWQVTKTFGMWEGLGDSPFLLLACEIYDSTGLRPVSLFYDGREILPGVPRRNRKVEFLEMNSGSPESAAYIFLMAFDGLKNEHDYNIFKSQQSASVENEKRKRTYYDILVEGAGFWRYDIMHNGGEDPIIYPNTITKTHRQKYIKFEHAKEDEYLKIIHHESPFLTKRDCIDAIYAEPDLKLTLGIGYGIKSGSRKDSFLKFNYSDNENGRGEQLKQIFVDFANEYFSESGIIDVYKDEYFALCEIGRKPKGSQSKLLSLCERLISTIYVELRKPKQKNKIHGGNYVGECYDEFIACIKKLTEESLADSSSNTNNITENTVSRIESNELFLSTYITLKNLYEKWFCGEMASNWDLLNEHSAYNKFTYIDNYYRNIGGRLKINPAVLNDVIKHCTNSSREDVTDSSVYEALTEIAQNNQCMLFAVPFMFGQTGDKESLLTLFDSKGFSECSVLEDRYTFVFLYTYAPSSKLDDGNVNDGFDIAGTLDNSKNVLPSVFERNDGNIIEYIPAFGVTYAKQNQGYFKNITLTSDNPNVSEYAIRATMNIASKAGEGPQDTMTIGQDMYRVFSNYSYKSSVTMMGNIMISPMMYFQLNNIPMWKGAYIITTVEHNITPGNMETTFSGYRISKNAYEFTEDASLVFDSIENGGIYVAGNGSSDIGAGRYGDAFAYLFGFMKNTILSNKKTTDALGQAKSMCALYSYLYCKLIDSTETFEKTSEKWKSGSNILVHAGANACLSRNEYNIVDQKIRDAGPTVYCEKLRTELGRHYIKGDNAGHDMFTKAEVMAYTNEVSNFKEGDLVVYWYDPEDNPNLDINVGYKDSQYCGHAQVFHPHGKFNWMTSVRNNYDSNFVYRSLTPDNSKWHLRVLRK